MSGQAEILIVEQSLFPVSPVGEGIERPTRHQHTITILREE
jgi:hypothetical protein